jgi:hypothetical protein
MNKKLQTEGGQAIVLIALAMVVMIAFIALAIDGGNVFSDRRHAQNAADTGSLAAALAKIAEQDWHTQGLNRIISNGYTNDGVESTVTIVNPPGPGCNGINGLYAGNIEYIQVIIHSNVKTYFAPIIGINQMHNCVEAIARSKPAVNVPLAFGNTLAALSCTASPGIGATGAASLSLSGGGAFSNSSAANSISFNKITNVVSPGGVSAVGGVGNIPAGYTPAPVPGHVQVSCPPPANWFPWQEPVFNPSHCNYTYANFPPSTSDTHVTIAGGVATLTPGIYCITGSFSTTNVNGIGVTIIMVNQGISWQGNASIVLKAPTGDPRIVPNSGLVIYLPLSNHSQIKLNGTAGLELTGTIFAPSANITLLGDFGSTSKESQWVSDTITLGGSLNGTIQFPVVPFQPPADPPAVSLTK